jgi:c-di-GMP-binding flagellar brake protein YcgR
MQNQAEILKKNERREYFRVEDLLPTSIRKIDENLARMKGKTIPGLQPSVGYLTVSSEDESINPVMMRKLNEINQKLQLLLDNMYLTSHGLTNINMKRVSLSSSGIGAVCDECFKAGDCVEIKILLTANTSFWVILYGRVTRITEAAESQWEIGIEFFEMGDEVRNALGAYIISRQREMICKTE